MSDDNLMCGTCNPGVVPKTASGQRSVQSHRWCNKCQCGRAFYPAAKTGATQKVKDDGKRACRWPGCKKRVEPRMWGCKTHWYALPANLRNDILAAYQPGQEDDLKMVSRDWVAADRRAREWIDAYAARGSQP